MQSSTLRKMAKEVLGETFGKAGKKEETWWWNAEVQEVITRKMEIKKERNWNRCDETIDKYKKVSKIAKEAVAKAISAVFRNLYSSREEKEGLRKAI